MPLFIDPLLKFLYGLSRGKQAHSCSASLFLRLSKGRCLHKSEENDRLTSRDADVVVEAMLPTDPENIIPTKSKKCIAFVT